MGSIGANTTQASWVLTSYVNSSSYIYADVSAYTVDIAPQVSGKVNHIYVINNEYVKKGTLLFSIAPAKYQITLNQDKAVLQSTKSNLEGVKSELNSAIAINNSAKFDYNCDKKLITTHAVSVEAYKHAYYNYKRLMQW